jgi:hypothetical protein
LRAMAFGGVGLTGSGFQVAVPAQFPLALTLNLDTGAFDQQEQRPLRPAVGDSGLKGVLAAAERAEMRHRLLSRPISRARPSTKPVIWRCAMPNNAFTVRRVGMRASLQPAGFCS